MRSIKKRLINLEKRTYARSKQWKIDVDYIDKLKTLAASGDSDAAYALEFMDSYFDATLGGDFTELKKISDVSSDFVKECRDEVNSTNRDLMSCLNQQTIVQNEDENTSSNDSLESIASSQLPLAELADDALAAGKKRTKEAQKAYYAKQRESKLSQKKTKTVILRKSSTNKY